MSCASTTFAFRTNKQKKDGWMTTYSKISTLNIILLFLRNRSFKEIGFTHKLNYHMITVLIGLNLYAIVNGNTGLCITNLVKFLGYYTSAQLHRYLDKLIACNLVSFNNRLYYLTEFGFSAVMSISKRSEELVYSFCSKHGLEL
jgi:hypothetical protein